MFTDKTLVKEPESTAVIRFQDCDPFGHLNNARYVDYFMDARTDHVLEHYGLSPFGDGSGECWVVSKSQIAFVSPARLMERVLIRTRLIHADERRLVVEGLMLNREGTRLKAVLWMEFTYISVTTGRPARHAEGLMQLFNAVRVEGYEIGFEARVDELRAAFRRQAAPVGEAVPAMTAA